MDLPEDEHAFLRDLVKAARQRTIHVKWVDRDGSDRQTSLTQAEAVRLNSIAQRLGTSKQEVLRRAAHIPVAKASEKKSPLPANSGDSPQA
jgi:dsRNA-specific ribonuclease